MQRHAGATRREGRRGGKQLKGVTAVAGHDIAIDQQLETADLHIVADDGQHAHPAPLDDLDARCGRVDVDRVGGNADGGRDAQVVETCVVDDRQTPRAGRHEGHATGNAHIVRRAGGEGVARLRGAGVRRVAGAHHVDHAKSTRTAHRDAETGTIERDRTTANGIDVDAAEQREIGEIGDTGGHETGQEASFSTNGRDTIGHEQTATCCGKDQRSSGDERAARGIEGTQGGAIGDREQRIAIDRDGRDVGCAGGQGLAHVARIDIHHCNRAAIADIRQTVAHLDMADQSVKRHCGQQDRGCRIGNVEQQQARIACGHQRTLALRIYRDVLRVARQIDVGQQDRRVVAGHIHHGQAAAARGNEGRELGRVDRVGHDVERDRIALHGLARDDA